MSNGLEVVAASLPYDISANGNNASKLAAEAAMLVRSWGVIFAWVPEYKLPSVKPVVDGVSSKLRAWKKSRSLGPLVARYRSINLPQAVWTLNHTVAIFWSCNGVEESVIGFEGL